MEGKKEKLFFHGGGRKKTPDIGERGKRGENGAFLTKDFIGKENFRCPLILCFGKYRSEKEGEGVLQNTRRKSRRKYKRDGQLGGVRAGQQAFIKMLKNSSSLGQGGEGKRERRGYALLRNKEKKEKHQNKAT